MRIGELAEEILRLRDEHWETDRTRYFQVSCFARMRLFECMHDRETIDYTDCMGRRWKIIKYRETVVIQPDRGRLGRSWEENEPNTEELTRLEKAILGAEDGF